MSYFTCSPAEVSTLKQEVYAQIKDLRRERQDDDAQFKRKATKRLLQVCLDKIAKLRAFNRWKEVEGHVASVPKPEMKPPVNHIKLTKLDSKLKPQSTYHRRAQSVLN